MGTVTVRQKLNCSVGQNRNCVSEGSRWARSGTVLECTRGWSEGLCVGMYAMGQKRDCVKRVAVGQKMHCVRRVAVS